MNTLFEFECDLSGLKDLAHKLVNISVKGDMFLLSGDLGAGKTTFARLFINLLFDQNKIIRPENIKSPSFPIMINYTLNDYEINHYDFYRLKDKEELIEINLFEDLKNNISIIEWPDIVLKNFNLNNYYLIQFYFINEKRRLMKVSHSKNKEI